MAEHQANSTPQIARTLGTYDVVNIIVGIIIGSGIFVIPAWVAGLLGSPGLIVFAWLAGGFLSLVGALTYAELASAYPKEGGDYFFLNHAYGSWAGFLYAWARLLVIHTGNIAMMSYIVGKYAALLLPFAYAEKILSITAVVVLTIINCIGVREGKWTQNLLTTFQILGLLSVVLVAFVVPAADLTAITTDITFQSFFLALIFVQFCFGGWSDAAFVASEVREPGKNILRSLVIGTLLVTVIYLLINLSMIYVLGPGGMAGSEAVIASVLETGFGNVGARLVSIVAIVVALGSVNGMILTGGRIFHAFGSRHRLFGFLGTRSARFHTPVVAFIVQAGVAIILVLSGKFEELVMYTASAHWLFMIATGITLFVFRYREPDVERPYRVVFYPITPLIYIASCMMLFYSAITYEQSSPTIGFLIVLSGIPIYFLAYWFEKRKR